MTALVPHHETTYRVCGVPIRATTARAAAERIVDAAVAGEPLEVHLCNSFTLSLVDDDPVLAAALARGYNLPDGAPVAWLGRSAGTAGPVRGADLVLEVIDAGVKQGVRHFFYGGAEGVADDMSVRLLDREPRMLLAGLETPPWDALGDEYVTALADRVRCSGANVVWVGLGTPKQDHLVPRLAPLVGVPVVPVGAAFDFFAGRVDQAPQWLHGTGLEWTHRFLQEPGRLWRRYLIGNPRFVARTIAHKVRERGQDSAAPQA